MSAFTREEMLDNAGQISQYSFSSGTIIDRFSAAHMR